jgi:membrane protease YdiL (CAAX protease family)
MMYVLVSVMAPLIEETAFRGLLFPALSRYLSPAASILLSGFMFGAIHPQGPLLWAALGGIGAVAALLSYLTGSLIPSMVMHACQNFCVLTLSVVLLY